MLDSLLKRLPARYAPLLADPGQYKLQVIYTEIDRDEKNTPSFKEYRFHVTKDYVYPASTVKLPIALLALMKLEALHIPGLDRRTTMITDSAFYCQKNVHRDSSPASGTPTLENYIQRMFLVSDNYSFARTYEFVGHDYAHARLEELGFKNIRLFNRLDGQCPGDTAKVTPPVYFLSPTGDTVYKQALTFPEKKLAHPIKNSRVGNPNPGRLGVKGIKDFSGHNYLEPLDLHHMMKALVFNNYASAQHRLPLSHESRRFLLTQLGLYPRESEHPRYDPKVYYDSFKKYFIYGASVATIKQDSVRIMNMVGRAYGFLMDCAYIVDVNSQVEFLLTACIYVNASGRVADGKYEYDQVGLPFMKDLGRSIYNYERTRRKKHAPDLSEFKTLFEKK